jgi:hypothetical protein
MYKLIFDKDIFFTYYQARLITAAKNEKNT